MIAGFLAAWIGHTDESRAFAQDIAYALDDAGISDKAASILMGLHSPQQFSRQLAGVEPLNAFRLAYLPMGFHLAFLRRRAVRVGAAVISPEELALIRGAAVLGRRRMVKMFPQPSEDKRSA